MASPAMVPPFPEPRASRGIRVLLSSVVVAPMVVAAVLLARAGWLSDLHGAFVSRVRFAADRGQLQLLGFEYPPLPFLMLLPSPTWWWIIVLGGAALFGLVWMVLDDCTWQRSMLPLIMLIGVLWTPIGLHLITGDFNEAIGLFALYVGWRHYRRWWATRKTIHGLYTGLWLGLAFYTSPLGLALALIAGAVLPLVFPRLQIPPFASQLVLLVFPGVAATATWAYLSWVFTRRVAFPFTPWEPASPGFITILQWTVPYLLVSFFALLRPKATTAGVLLPFALLVIANRVGWHFSLAFATGLLILVAIVALPRELRTWQRALIGLVVIAQAVVAWLRTPWPEVPDSDRAAQAIATALAQAPPRSILIDDRHAPRLLKWAPTMQPYLTTRDAAFELALAEPQATVRYILVTETEAGHTLDTDVRQPVGFVTNWSWAGYTLYRRVDAHPIAVRYDALLANRGTP